MSYTDDPRYRPSLRSRIDRVEEGLYIGNMYGRAELAGKNIGLVISVLTDSERACLVALAPDITERAVGLDDVQKVTAVLLGSILDETTPLIARTLAEGKGVFVHCAAGISRSATVVLDYLMASRRVTFDAALNVLQEARFCVAPNPTFLRILRSREPEAARSAWTPVVSALDWLSALK